MPTPAMTMRVTGDKKLAGKMGSVLYAVPVSRFFRSSGQTIKGRAQDNAPRFDGNLVNSIQVETDSGTPMRFVRVGTNAEYAEPVETGSRPHFPPLAAITPWAEAHDIEPFALALHISRVGTKPHPYLEPALTDSKADIIRLLGRMGSEIEAQAGAL